MLINNNAELRARVRLRHSPLPLTISTPTTVERSHWEKSPLSLEEDKSIRNEIILSFKDKGFLEMQLDKLKAHVDSMRGRNAHPLVKSLQFN